MIEEHHIDAAELGCAGFQDGGDDAVGGRTAGITGGDFNPFGGGAGAAVTGTAKRRRREVTPPAIEGMATMLLVFVDISRANESTLAVDFLKDSFVEQESL